MWHNLAQLARYRGLIQSLVARELKARYRGSVLGFFWSFVNPLLLLSIYSFVFTYDPAEHDDRDTQPYALFMFCGLLPWTWFSSSLHRVAGLADLRRQPDQESAVPGRSAADRQRAGEHGALLPRACRFWPAFMIWLSAALSGSGASWSGFRSIVARPAACFTIGAGAAPLGAHRALPRHPRSAVEPADVLVLRDADHLSAYVHAAA